MITCLHHLVRWMPLTLAALAVIACGQGSDTVAGIDRGGIRTVAVGPVTGFGSIWLNGERYDVESASISIDGQPASQADLRIGQVVTLSGEIDTDTSARTANTVGYESNLEGPVSDVNLTLGTLTLLGQTVFVDSNTIWGSGIAPADLTGIASGDLLEVSGLVDNEQRLLATRIDRPDTLDEYIVSGRISSVRTDIFTFVINGQSVDYSAASLQGFVGNEPKNGDLVRVRADDLQTAPLLATNVAKRGNTVTVEENDEGEIEGLITDFDSPAEFRLAGVPVRTNTSTVYSDGSAANLALNARIEAEGSFDASGVLLASEIKFRLEGNAEIEAVVDANMTADNEIVVFGISVEVNALTLLEDQSDQKQRPFTIGDIQPGDYLKIAGYENTGAGATVIATRLERINGEDQEKLRGIARNLSQPNFELLGVTVITSGQTEFLLDDSPIDADVFFSSADGLDASAQGTRQGISLNASEVELDD